MLPFLVTALLLAALIVRRHWLNNQLEAYLFKAIYYVSRTRKGDDVQIEMAQFWPYSTMLLEIWRWDFPRYIVHQDHYEEMEAFIEEERLLTPTQLAARLLGDEAVDVSEVRGIDPERREDDSTN